MKKKIKKNRLKIFIALSLMITTIFGVMFATNTFAYNENYNKISDTLDTSTLYLGNFNLNTTIKTELGSNNENYSFIEVQHTASDSIQMSFGINLKNSLNYVNDSGNYIALMNLEFGYYSTSTGSWTTYTNSSQYLTAYCGPTSTTNNYGTQTRMLYYSQNDYGYNYKSAIIQLYNYNSVNNFNNIIYFNFRLPTSVNKSIYCVRIYNIDIVPNNEIYTQQYIDTYYTPLENQYNQLLEDYETLEENYDTLNDNYTELEENYEQLESDYNNLNEEYNNVFHFNNKNGIFEYISYVTMGTTSNLTKYYNLSLDDLKSGGYLNEGVLNLTDPIVSSISENYAVDNHSENFVLRINFDESRLVDLSLLNIITNMYFDPIYTNTNCYIEMNGVINNWYTYDSISTPNLIGENYKFNPFYELPTIDFNIWHLAYIEYSLSTENLNVNPLVNTTNMSLVTSDLNYVNGYATGYNNATNDKNRTIDNLNETIRDIRSRLRTANGEIASLQWQVANGTDTYGLNNLMWTIASTPFESFKHIWNVKFLGVNIADFILGLLTTFIGLYIVKKFFL